MIAVATQRRRATGSRSFALVFSAGLVISIAACQTFHPKATADVLAAPTAPLARGEIRRTLVEKHPAGGAPGWETRLYLVEYGPAAVAPLHVHPAVGIGYVLQGGFESAFEGRPLTEVHAGQSFVDPAGAPHRLFRNLSRDQSLRFVIAYTIKTTDEQFYKGPALPLR